LSTKNHTNSFKVRVRYADVDKMGFAYYANYLRWFEIGRTELLRELGLIYAEVEEGGVIYPVTESYVKYITPARYDELIEIRTRFDYIKKASLKLNYEIVSAGSGEIHARGYTIHAAMDKDGKIVRVSERLIALVGSKG
jgi:acyl-CoA thioester hydrolase